MVQGFCWVTKIALQELVIVQSITWPVCCRQDKPISRGGGYLVYLSSEAPIGVLVSPAYSTDIHPTR